MCVELQSGHLREEHLKTHLFHQHSRGGKRHVAINVIWLFLMRDENEQDYSV